MAGCKPLMFERAWDPANRGHFLRKSAKSNLARLGDQTCALSLIMPLMSDLRAIWRSTWILAALGLVVAGIRDSCSGYAGFRSLLLFAGLSFLSLSLFLDLSLYLSLSFSFSLSVSVCFLLSLSLSDLLENDVSLIRFFRRPHLVSFKIIENKLRPKK